MNEVKAKIEVDTLLDWKGKLELVLHNLEQVKIGTVHGGQARVRLEHAITFVESVLEEIKREHLNAF